MHVGTAERDQGGERTGERDQGCDPSNVDDRAVTAVEPPRQSPDGPTQVPLDALVEFAASTLIGLGMRGRLGNDLPHTPREVDQIYRRLTEPAIRAGLQPRA